MASPAAIGFRVQTARAVAVLLAGSRAAPRVLERRLVELWDPGVPESRQPYHAAMELAEEKGAEVVRRASQAVLAVAIRTVRQLAADLGATGHDPCGVGLVVGSNIDPAKLGNGHVRAHASEGRLFREVLEAGADACGLSRLTLVERDLHARAATALGRPAEELKRVATDLGAAIGRPWRAEEKAATLVAWIALSR